MIPIKTIELMRNAVAVATRGMPEEAIRRANGVVAAEAARGWVGKSSRCEFLQRSAYYDVMKEAAERAWSEMKRVIDEVGVKPSANTEEELRRFLREVLTPTFDSLRSAVAKFPKDPFVSPHLPDFTKDHEQTLERLFNEVGIFCAKNEAREAEKEARRVNQTITNNLHGANPRINLNSQDHSININDSKFIFETLRTTIEGITDQQLKAKLLSKSSEMETAVGNKATFLKRYSEFVELAANHMSLLGPFIPALTQFLNH